MKASTVSTGHKTRAVFIRIWEPGKQGGHSVGTFYRYSRHFEYFPPSCPRFLFDPVFCFVTLFHLLQAPLGHS